jgi:hypothetical protein
VVKEDKRDQHRGGNIQVMNLEGKFWWMFRSLEGTHFVPKPRMRRSTIVRGGRDFKLLLVDDQVASVY